MIDCSNNLTTISLWGELKNMNLRNYYAIEACSLTFAWRFTFDNCLDNGFVVNHTKFFETNDCIEHVSWSVTLKHITGLRRSWRKFCYWHKSLLTLQIVTLKKTAILEKNQRKVFLPLAAALWYWGWRQFLKIILRFFPLTFHLL